MTATRTKKRAFREKEAAEYIGMSRSYLAQDRMNGSIPGRVPGPRHIKVGSRSVRYCIEDLDDWLDQFKEGE